MADDIWKFILILVALVIGFEMDDIIKAVSKAWNRRKLWWRK